MPFLILSVIIQVAFIIHVLRNGRNTTWIWIIMLLPMAGVIAYFIMEILPDLTNSRKGRQAQRKIKTIVDPNREINDARREFEIAATNANALRLADACMEKKLYQEAKDLYAQCLRGLNVDDADTMFKLARAKFALGNYLEVKQGLDGIREKNPNYRNQEAHLLYARALNGLNESDAAEHEFEALHSYFSGPEASYYYAKFLKEKNRNEQPQNVLKEILVKADRSGQHYKTLHSEYLKRAKQLIRTT